MTRKTLVGMALAVLTLGAVLAGCGGGTTTGHDMSSMSGSATKAPAAGQGDHNPADVAFAQQMIPHHQQALDMAKLVSSRTTNTKVVDLAGRIEKAQDPEIQQMTGWLSTWGAAANGMNMPGMTSGQPMPGMMNYTDMTKLQGMKGAEFDRMWLQMMIRHHQGAIDMAKTELAQGSNTDAKTLAQKIIDGQQAEITEMNGLLGQD
ncbi:DUF305 domain-containing protein [Amycolatopsis acidiphila]|uniref:DUF305 domain-containing protein n=1 Tax=Amycolatopsis acidiphila TaxID=715473 RepID=A0A558ANR9_9PSEU|nr:DUF305 domain-containing protein [Amycolatopsis acidiphila]TVT25909.1 DUF305 domain-containing protein [Amycolatopsis acidiphila]UIJ63385.1 DUF305 domain-containing protein [Amycolatopsis acidiphila]GHG75315.1 hypothetical protein GCM10017788_40120 [Amycolatopsis acidiphila]